MERLDKVLCDSGVGTRSQVKVILKSGRVAVDGKVEKDNSRKIWTVYMFLVWYGVYFAE